MSKVSNFLTASRKKFRFSSSATFPGINQTRLTTEQLWDIPLVSESRMSINGLYIEYSDIRDASKKTGLVSKPSVEDEDLNIKIEILKEIFETRTAEEEMVRNHAKKRAMRQELLDDIAAAEKAERGSKSPSELRALLKALDEA